MPNLTDNKQDPKFTVNVEWTPGETGKNPTQDQKPSIWARMFGTNRESLQIELRQEAKLEILVKELQKTDPDLVNKAYLLLDGKGDKRELCDKNDHVGDGVFKVKNTANGRLDGYEISQMITRHDFTDGNPLPNIDFNKDKKVSVEELRAEMQKFVAEKADHASNLTPTPVSNVASSESRGKSDKGVC